MQENRSRMRKPTRKTPLCRAVLHTALVAAAGVALGAAAKLLDLYAAAWGDVFSQMSVWIFLCTLISVFSSTPWWAAARVFFFCGGMLSAYYVTAELTASVYAMQFVWGWFLFSLICAVLAFVLWYGRGSGWVSYVIVTGVILIMLALAVILFDKIRVADLIFAALTGVVLFRKQPLAGK